MVASGSTLRIRTGITDCGRVPQGAALPKGLKDSSAPPPPPPPRVSPGPQLAHPALPLRSRATQIQVGNLPPRDPEQPCSESAELWSLSPVPEGEPRVMGSVQPPSPAEKTVQEWRSTCFEKAKAQQAPRPPGECPLTLIDATRRHLKAEAYLICL